MSELDINIGERNFDLDRLSDHKLRVLAICRHGQSRSKYVRRALNQLGYENTNIIGVNDPNEERRVEDEVDKYDLIISASSDTSGELRRKIPNLGIPILEIEITNKEHIILTNPNSDAALKNTVLDSIKQKLITMGFIQKQNSSN